MFPCPIILQPAKNYTWLVGVSPKYSLRIGISQPTKKERYEKR